MLHAAALPQIRRLGLVCGRRAFQFHYATHVNAYAEKGNLHRIVRVVTTVANYNLVAQLRQDSQPANTEICKVNSQQKQHEMCKIGNKLVDQAANKSFAMPQDSEEIQILGHPKRSN